MVIETLEEQVIALVRKHYGTVITGCSPEITPGSDIDADIGMDWADAEGLMEDFFGMPPSLIDSPVARMKYVAAGCLIKSFKSMDCSM